MDWKVRIQDLFLLLTLIQSTVFAQTSTPANSLNELLGEILQLESDLEPKYDATATRLEDFMYDTALTFKVSFKKIKLQKSLILDIWQRTLAGKLYFTLSREFLHGLGQERLAGLKKT